MATRYTYSQLEGLWIQAGGSKTQAPVMAAIAEAESGGNPNATGGVGEKGLWQINPHTWGSLATYDPLGNARAAVTVRNSQGLSAWSTYNSGAYKAFLNSSTSPSVGGSGQAPGTTTAGGRGSGASPPTPAELAGVAAAGEVTAALGQITTLSDCAWSLDWLKGSGFFGGLISDVVGAGTVCLIHKSQVRALLSAGILVAGGITLLVGLGYLLNSTTGIISTAVGIAKKAAEVAAVA